MGWTDERVELLKKLWQDGLSASQIAKQLGGVTRNAVIGKVHRLGLAGRASPSRSERPRMPMAPKAPSVRSHVPAVPVNVMAQLHPDNFCDPASAKYRNKYAEIARRPTHAELEDSWRRARELDLKFETATFEHTLMPSA